MTREVAYLEPDFDLTLRQLECRCDLDASGATQVFVEVKFLLQLEQLVRCVRRSQATRDPVLTGCCDASEARGQQESVRYATWDTQTARQRSERGKERQEVAGVEERERERERETHLSFRRSVCFVLTSSLSSTRTPVPESRGPLAARETVSGGLRS